MSPLRWMLPLFVGLAAEAQPSPIDLNNRGATLFLAGEYWAAEVTLRSALAAEESERDEATLATVYFNLAASARVQGRYREAEQRYREVIRLRESIGGSTSAELLQPLQGLSAALLGDNQPNEGEQYARRAVEVARSVPGGAHDVALAETCLANALVAQSRFTEAERTALDAMRLFDQVQDVHSSSYAEALNTLGVICRHKVRYVEAEAYLRKALAVYENKGEAPDTAKAATWNNLGQVLSEEGKLKEASALFQRAMDAWRAKLGPAHPDVASVMSNLACVYRQRRDYAKAEDLFSEALEIDRQALGNFHSKVALDLNNLAAESMHRHHWDEAESRFLHALDVLAKGNSSAADAGGYVQLVSGNLGMLYLKQRRFADAEKSLRRALRADWREADQSGSRQRRLLEAYGHVLRVNGKYAEAAIAENRAMTLRVHDAMGQPGPAASFKSQH